MYLYNVTYIVEDATANDWLTWFNDNHIPAIMASEKFVSHRLLTVIDSPNEGITFCSQFIAESKAAIKAYQTLYEATNQANLQNEFPNKFVSFSTLMEFIA